jgi:hypothetical protein
MSFVIFTTFGKKLNFLIAEKIEFLIYSTLHKKIEFYIIATDRV